MGNSPRVLPSGKPGAVHLDAELGLQPVGDAPGLHFAGEPVHDGDRIDKAFPHPLPGRRFARQIGREGAGAQSRAPL